MLGPRMSEEDSGSSGTGVTDGCKILCGCWKLNLGPLPEQTLLLTTEPPVQLLVISVFKRPKYGASKKPQQVKVLAAQAWQLQLDSKTCVKIEAEN